MRNALTKRSTILPHGCLFWSAMIRGAGLGEGMGVGLCEMLASVCDGKLPRDMHAGRSCPRIRRRLLYQLKECCITWLLLLFLLLLACEFCCCCFGRCCCCCCLFSVVLVVLANCFTMSGELLCIPCRSVG